MNSAMHLFNWGMYSFLITLTSSGQTSLSSNSFLNNFVHLDKILFGLFIFFPFAVWSRWGTDRCCCWITVFLKKCLQLDDHGIHHHFQLAYVREDGSVDQHPHGALNLVVNMRFLLVTLINFTICGFFDKDFSCIVTVVIDIFYEITSDKLLLSFIIISVVE